MTNPKYTKSISEKFKTSLCGQFQMKMFESFDLDLVYIHAKYGFVSIRGSKVTSVCIWPLGMGKFFKNPRMGG